MNASIVSSGRLHIRPANGSDLDRAKVWLCAAGLPVEDLTADHLAQFLVAMENDNAVGMIGLEQFGVAGLLRSLVVDKGSRGAGVGRQLVAALESAALENGAKELWLLTIDADLFFTRLGYAVADRADAPTVIRETAEFSSLCPGDAVLMYKKL